MSTVTLRWIGDLDQDKREQAGCVSSSSDQYRPKKIELKPGQKEIRIGRINTKMPPDYPIESCINSRMISRNHATIERSAKGGSMLYDHSMNGTYVNYTRVIGGVTLKHGDIVCFGHLNGANLKPGEKVSLFYSDLKYRVELSDAPPSKEAPASTGNVKKRKAHMAHSGSTVSSTQRSEEEDEEDAASGDSGEDTKRSKTNTGAGRSMPSKHKPFKKPTANTSRRKLEDDDDDDDLDDDEEDGASVGKRSTSSAKASKKKTNGTEKNKKTVHSSSSSKKPSVNKGAHGKEKRTKSSKTKSGTDEADASGNEMFHYDTEECSARPCKQPQDIAIDWIQCDKCALWYHQVCVGLKPSDANVDTYYCPYCKK